jgi:hypothetical protein
MVPSFVPLGALIKVAPVVAVPKAKVAASYIVSDTTPAADSYVVEAVVEEPDPRDEEPVRARDSVTYYRDEYLRERYEEFRDRDPDARERDASYEGLG